jgi:predicted N-acetyltransferase YhbS
LLDNTAFVGTATGLAGYNAFMAMELIPDALNGVCGKVRYPVAFGL